ncbi:MAG TPA: HAD family hydrolase [Bryobacteraceae bacterium]|nr:HAD family hydrolase [Bryobacteraceae bacterium]
MELRRSAFLDRDGVINVSPAPGDYIRSWEEFRLIPEAVEWIRLFNALDLLVIVLTNQRGVSRGLIPPSELQRIHRNMVTELARLGARIDDVFCCPHADNTCDCRKPRPGLVWQAASKWNIDVARSILLGDSANDRQLAENCGMHFVEVWEGHVLGSLRVEKEEQLDWSLQV